MKEMVKMTKTEFAVFVLMSVCSGIVIAIGGTASLLANNLFGTWGRLIGACLFTLGIYAIVMYEMRLFTGMVAAIPKMGLKNTWKLPVCFLGNIIGVAIVAVLVYYTPISANVVSQAKQVASAKLAMDNWAVTALCSSVLCGALITLSVWSVKYAPKKSLSATLGVLFPIAVFAFCGFDHSVANMLYFYYLGEFSLQVVGYSLLCIVGNVVGGVILPLISLLREHSKKRES